MYKHTVYMLGAIAFVISFIAGLIIMARHFDSQRIISKDEVYLVINYDLDHKIKKWWIVPQRYNGFGHSIAPHLWEDGASFLTKENQFIRLKTKEKIIAIKTTYKKLPELKREYLKTRK